ncbi:angiopoietin-related protein 7 [Ixodes scapularis]
MDVGLFLLPIILLLPLPVWPAQVNDSSLGLSMQGSGERPLLEALLEQGLLQVPHLLRQQEARAQELWRALDQRLQQQVDAVEARLSLRLESLKSDLAKGLALQELLREDFGQLQREQLSCRHWNRCPETGAQNGVQQGLRRSLGSLQGTLSQLQYNVTALLADSRYLRNQSQGAVTRKHLVEALGNLEQRPNHLQLSCVSATPREPQLPVDCWDMLQERGRNISGVYRIRPLNSPEPLFVYCDMETDGGGWTLIQRRHDGSVEFQREWNDYKHGFGNVAGEFWLGNSHIHRLTAQKLYQLRVELEDFEGVQAHALYTSFALGSEKEQYALKLLGAFEGGEAGDGLSPHAAMGFSTPDVDNDQWEEGSCARDQQGSWWYNQCGSSSLNGGYLQGPAQLSRQGLHWLPWPSALRSSALLLRPVAKALTAPTVAPLDGP